MHITIAQGLVVWGGGGVTNQETTLMLLLNFQLWARNREIAGGRVLLFIFWGFNVTGKRFFATASPTVQGSQGSTEVCKLSEP